MQTSRKTWVLVMVVSLLCWPVGAAPNADKPLAASSHGALEPMPEKGFDHHQHVAFSIDRLPPTEPWQERLEPAHQLALGLPVTALKNEVGPCDDSGFATKTGQDLVDHIRQAPTDATTNNSCVNRLFTSAPEAVRFAAFQGQNMIDVANATASLAASYDGTNATNLQQLFLFLRAGYFTEFYNPEQLGWGPVVQSAMVAALDTFVANSHFYDDTEAHAEVLGEALIAMDSAEEQARYVPVVREWLGRWNSSYASKWDMRSAVNALFTLLFRGHQQQAFRDATASDTALMNALRDFAAATWMAGGDAEFMAANAGRELARFLQYDGAAIFSSARAGVQTVLSTYTMTGSGAPIWIATASVANFYEDCNQYGTCGFEAQLEAQILSIEHSCSATLQIRAQDLTAQQLQDSCQLLALEETYFHQRLDTGNDPVANDFNDALEMVIFASPDDYSTYSGLFFGNNTNNGGIYLEGDPSDPNNQARFIAYEATWLPEFAIWNLEHEYVHYLDGRFDMLGSFGDYRVDSHKTVWWLEGLAEYISKKNDNPTAVDAAASGTYSLSTLFGNTYSSGTTRVYTWGYLAVRFMFEQHPGEVDQILAYFRAGDYDNYLSYIDNSIGSAYDGEWATWLGNVTTDPDPDPDPGVTALANGVAVSGLTADTGETLDFYLEVPVGATDLRFEIAGGSGDADLYVRFGAVPTVDDYDCRPYVGGNAESCDEASPQAGRWYAQLRGYSSFSGVTLTGSFATDPGGGGGGPVALENGVAVGGLAGAVGETLDFYLDVPAGASDLTIAISGGTGDADLYVRRDAVPTTTEYDCRPYIGGNAESCDEASPQEGRWYVQLRGYSSFADVTLSAGFTAAQPTHCTGPTVTGGELQGGVAVCVAESSQRRYFYAFLPADTSSVTIQLAGGTGNADLYVRSGTWPSTTEYDGRSIGASNDETVTLSNPVSGWLYIMLTDEVPFAGASLSADF